jgi:phosphohistidine phosphatase
MEIAIGVNSKTKADFTRSKDLGRRERGGLIPPQESPPAAVRSWMDVVIVRHGPAADKDPVRWPDDRRRPLSPGGIRATRRAAKGLARLRPAVDKIVSSPATRAYATAVILQKVLQVDSDIETWEELEPEGTPGPILERLQHLSRRRGVVLVGHEPTLGELLGLSVTGESVPIARFSKAGAAQVRFPREARAGAGEIDWVLTRKQLERLG